MNDYGDKDPYDDPFAADDYDPAAAFAFQARDQSRQKLNDIRGLLAHHESLASENLGLIHKAARKTVLSILDKMVQLVEHAERCVQIVLSSAPDSAAHQQAVLEAVRCLHECLPLHDEAILFVSHVGSSDPSLPAIEQRDIGELDDPRKASHALGTSLQDWVDQHIDARDGAMAILHTTPGVGKTHQIFRSASDLQMRRKKRVIFAARTKEMILSPDGELYKRAIASHPVARNYTLPIYGRDETNCYQTEAVELSQQHGYSPGRSVCFGCEHSPKNAYSLGLPVCGYYQSRIAARNVSLGVRMGRINQYPLVLTTHAALVSAIESDGGMYGECWGSDIIFIDEDPTDAIETDIVCSEEQMSFQSTRQEHVDTSELTSLLRSAVRLAASQRSEVASYGFRAAGSKENNSHPIHSKYDSVFASQDLWSLLEYAQTSSGSRVPLDVLLRNVVESGSFHIQPGDMSGVSSIQELNAREVPPRTIYDIADALFREHRHRENVGRAVLRKMTGKTASVAQVEAKTDVNDLAYQVRLECVPASVDKGRLSDSWRFVYRQVRTFANSRSLLVVGDAYANQEHYRYLFEREPEVIESVSALHPDTKMVRVLHSGANIGTLTKGYLVDVLGAAEALLRDRVKPGDRLLVYGHNELRESAEKFLTVLKRRYQLADCAFEHWWGGRGKDAYNGWEFVVTISDPVLSIGGLKHVVNARAFRDAEKATDDDVKIAHAPRILIASPKHGLMTALRSSHPRVILEHERSNVAELTQAIHRVRPVHNPAHIYTIGEMERSSDLLAQTITIVPQDARFEQVSKSRRTGRKGRADRQTMAIQGSINAFVTPHETLMAIRACVDHFGVWHPYFAHVLVTAANAEWRLRGLAPSPCSEDSTQGHQCAIPSQPADPSAVSADGFQCRETQAWSIKILIRPRLRFAHSGTDSAPSERLSRNPSLFLCHSGVPLAAQMCATAPDGHTSGANANQSGHLDAQCLPDGEEARRSLLLEFDREWGAEAGADGVLKALPSSKTLLQRLWDPPVYWEALSRQENLPRAVVKMRDHDFRALGLVPFTPSRQPTWMVGRRGPKATAWYDPQMLGVRPDLAERLLFRILDNQYGIVGREGDLVRPNFVPELPLSRYVPF